MGTCSVEHETLAVISIALYRSRMTEGCYDTQESFFDHFINDIRRVFDNATAYNYDADHVNLARVMKNIW